MSVTNLQEITANAQPGWTAGANNTTYSRSTLAVLVNNASPPTTITGNLDPPAAGNRPPVLASIGAKSANEGQALTFKATATDPHPNTALTFSAGNLPTGATLNATTGDFSWTPTFSQAGNYDVTITVTDNGSPAASDFAVVPGTTTTLGFQPCAPTKLGDIRWTVTIQDPAPGNNVATDRTEVERREYRRRTSDD